MYPGFATKANRIMIEDMLGIKKGDRLLITTSPSVPWELADSVREYAEGIGVKTRILSVGRMYGEPPSEAITSLHGKVMESTTWAAEVGIRRR